MSGNILTPPSTAVHAVSADAATLKATMERGGTVTMDFTPTYFKLFLDIISILNKGGGLTGAASAARKVLTSAPLSGGGDLTADRTIALALPGATGDVLTKGAGNTLANVTGLTVVITTAKLTAGGANGSMTFTNGILTAQVAAT